MRKFQILFPLLLVFGAARVEAEPVPVTFRVAVPSFTPAGDPVYIAGDFQGWNPGSPAHQLSAVDAYEHEITLQLEPGLLQFKFTRGSWDKVEKGPNGEEIANRTWTLTEAESSLFTVANWADLSESPHTIVGNVVQIEVPDFLDGRRVWVYLPPSYIESVERFPVLYMLDGQNVFDVATSFVGEWEVDETCEALIEGGEVEPLIVVAVDNGGAQRIQEYTPWFDEERNAGGGGAEHLSAIVEVLIPYVNQTYRTETDRAHTGFGGSSLGGLMASYAAYAHPEVFGRIASVSPSVSWADYELLDWVSSHAKPSSRVWIDMGTLEWGGVDEDANGVNDAIDSLRFLRDAMVEQGFALEVDLISFEDPGAQHNEAAWSRRFPDMLRFLFPSASVPASRTSVGEHKSRFR